MKALIIQIPQPCAEDWNRMHPVDQGKHCSHCEKTVIDFSGMRDRDIYEILTRNKGKKICGNFYISQLQRPVYGPVIYRKTTSWPVIASMFLAGMFSLNRADAQTQDQVKQTNATQQRVNFEAKKGVEDTEPKKDSTRTYKITIMDADTRINIPYVDISITGMGDLRIGSKGFTTITIQDTKLPDIISVTINAGTAYKTSSFKIEKRWLLEERELTWFLHRPELMLRGDIMITD